MGWKWEEEDSVPSNKSSLMFFVMAAWLLICVGLASVIVWVVVHFISKAW